MAISNNDITPDDQNAIMRQMGKMPQQAIHKGLGHLLMTRVLQPHEAVGVLNKIQKVKEDDIKQSDKAMIEKPKPPTPEETAVSNHLKGIAEKAHNPITAPDTEKTYGKDLVGAATKMHPITGMPHIFSQIHHIVPSEKSATSKQDTIQSQEEGQPPNIIQPTKDLRAWNLGRWDGKPETKKAAADIKTTVLQGRTKAGGTGESFNAFNKRVIPILKNALETAPNHTTLISHSSVLKSYRVWDKMGRPDLDNMTPEMKKTFAENYNKESTHNGEIEDYKGNNGIIHVIRHGETEDNKEGNFRDVDDQLTDKGIEQAAQTGEKLKSKLKGSQLPGIISSDLPRTMETSQIINKKINGNAGISTPNAGNNPIG